MQPRSSLLNWGIFIALSLIWGSSFILMKIGLDNQLSPYDIAAVRILSSGLVLLPVAFKAFRSIPVEKRWPVFLSGTLGSLLPAFLFCIAEEGIDSSLAGTLNALTPVFVILVSAIVYKTHTPLYKIIGICLAFAGSILLLLSNRGLNLGESYLHVAYVILATLLYGINVNMVSRQLSQIPSLHIASVALSLNAIPALLVLIVNGYFTGGSQTEGWWIGSAAAAALGILGTALASVIFYMLVKRAGGIFASMVTYGIPFVAIGWGIVYGESYGWIQVGCLLLILAGVYLTNRTVSDTK